MDQHILEETFQLRGHLLLVCQLLNLQQLPIHLFNQPLLVCLQDLLMNLLKLQLIETHMALPTLMLPHRKIEGVRMLQCLLAPNMVQLLIPQQIFLHLTTTLMLGVPPDLTPNLAQQFQVRL